jgi:transcriptional regulator with XRE-family HTH domain
VDLNIIKSLSAVKGELHDFRQQSMKDSQPVAPQSVAERIAHARRLLGVREGRDILPPEIAKRLGVSSESVYNWEGGSTIPGEANMAKLAALLRVTPAYLRYGVESRANEMIDGFTAETAKPAKKRGKSA